MFKEAPVQSIALHPNYTTAMLRLDRLHAEISGNKWFKLKENLAFAKKQGINRILTFGGAFSNHIAATAAACKAIGFESIGVIRGQDSDLNNPTLQLAIRQGMQLHLVGRDQYLLKEDAAFIQNLQRLYGPFHLIPEGGNNLLGVMGCKDILQQRPFYDYVFCACGTGTTMAGLVAANTGAVVVGISVLKGRNQLPEAVQRLLIQASPNYTFQVFGNDILDRDFVNGYARRRTKARKTRTQHHNQPFSLVHSITRTQVPMEAHPISAAGKFTEELIATAVCLPLLFDLLLNEYVCVLDGGAPRGRLSSACVALSLALFFPTCLLHAPLGVFGRFFITIYIY